MHKEIIIDNKKRLNSKKKEILIKSFQDILKFTENDIGQTTILFSTPKNRCVFTGRSRSVWSKFKLSRIQLRRTFVEDLSLPVSKK